MGRIGRVGFASRAALNDVVPALPGFSQAASFPPLWPWTNRTGMIPPCRVGAMAAGDVSLHSLFVSRRWFWPSSPIEKISCFRPMSVPGMPDACTETYSPLSSARNDSPEMLMSAGGWSVISRTGAQVPVLTMRIESRPPLWE